jgi:hypothetical protein
MGSGLGALHSLGVGSGVGLGVGAKKLSGVDSGVDFLCVGWINLVYKHNYFANEPMSN